MQLTCRRIVHGLCSLMLYVLPLRLLAEGDATTLAKQAPAGNELGAASSLLQMSLGLLFVLILIFVAAWFARRFGRLHTAAHGAIRVIGGMPMGTRERIVLVQVGETQLLLGVAPGRIDTLHVLDKPIEVPTASSPEQPGESFAERLASALRGKS